MSYNSWVPWLFVVIQMAFIALQFFRRDKKDADLWFGLSMLAGGFVIGFDIGALR